MTPFNEAETQLLIALVELAQPVETPNNNFYRFYPQTLEEAASYFKSLRVDWTAAYTSLAARGLIDRPEPGAALTPAGLEAARELRRARPPIYYWYREYYTTAPTSPAYTHFCEQLYGRALCQANFSDMGQLDALLAALALRPGEQVLDLGCGTGLIAEYLAGASSAVFTGIDYCPDAIALARQRTAGSRDRFQFFEQNLDTLDFPEASFDALVAIDTLYMPNDLDQTLRKMAALLKPGGRMGIFYSTATWDVGGGRQALLPENTPLGAALRRVGLPFRTWDFSEATYRHLQRKRQIGEALRAEFAAEGRLDLWNYILAESESSDAPFDPQNFNISRYLYRVEKGTA